MSEILPDNIVELNQEIKEITIYSNDIIGNFITYDDPRLIDSRNPLPHKVSHSISGSDPLSPEDIGAQPSGIYVTPPVDMVDLSNDTNESLNVIKRLAKAWVNFNGTGTISIRGSFNISSITDNGTGDYTINFLVPFSNTNYSFFTWSRDWDTNNQIYHGLSARSNTSKTVSSIRLLNNNMSNGFNYDSSECHVLFFGV